MHTVSPKNTRHLTLGHNYGKCRANFEILSLSDPQGNCHCNCGWEFQLNFNCVAILLCEIQQFKIISELLLLSSKLSWFSLKLTKLNIQMTRNAWQNLAYSPLGAVVSPLANTNETHLLTYLSLPCLAAPAPTVRIPEKYFDADCTTYYFLNSGVTKPNLTKFLQGVQKWLPITLLK